MGQASGSGFWQYGVYAAATVMMTYMFPRAALSLARHGIDYQPNARLATIDGFFRGHEEKQIRTGLPGTDLEETIRASRNDNLRYMNQS